MTEANKLPPEDDQDLILIPRDLVGAACSAIDKKRDAPNLLAKLRYYTTGDLSSQAVREAVPEGYVLVPVDPTEAMLGSDFDASVCIGIDDARIAYKAMIAAAQESQPANGEKD